VRYSQKGAYTPFPYVYIQGLTPLINQSIHLYSLYNNGYSFRDRIQQLNLAFGITKTLWSSLNAGSWVLVIVPSRVVTMTLWSSLPSLIWYHVIKKNLCDSLVIVDDPTTDTELRNYLILSLSPKAITKSLKCWLKRQWWPYGLLSLSFIVHLTQYAALTALSWCTSPSPCAPGRPRWPRLALIARAREAFPLLGAAATPTSPAVGVLDRQPTKGSTRSRWMWPRRDQ
jgi:hypothetical protein